jgi:hypothetical protein
MSSLSEKLMKLYNRTAGEDWPWFENVVAYDNARLSQALVVTGSYLEDDEMLQTGLKSLQWLIDIQTNPEGGHLSLIGNEGWYRRDGEKAQYDQQTVDAAALADACYQAFVLTGEESWLRKMEWAFNWFFGNNDVRQSLYDFSSGACYDGLQPGGVNRNQGGESIVSLLLTLHRAHLVAHQGLK